MAASKMESVGEKEAAPEISMIKVIAPNPVHKMVIARREVNRWAG